jgi:hypothetical protein
MSINARWKKLAACAAITLALAACGGDDNTGNGNGGADGGANGTANNGASTGNNGDTGNTGNTGDGSANNGDVPLEPGVVGKACTADADCGPSGDCRDPLNGGTYAGESLGGSGPTAGYCSATCNTDAECGEGGVCFGPESRRGGECRKACNAAADCKRDNYECAQLNNPPLIDEDTAMEVAVPKTCQPLRTPVSFTNEVGNACADETACNGGTCREGGQWPGGYCSGSCNADSDCGAEGVCLLRLYGKGGSCYESCNVDTDCKRDAMNYGCIDAINGVKICAFKMDPLPAGIVGKACAADTDCANGECKDGFGNLPAPEGYCSADDCEDDAVCGAGAVCLSRGRTTSCLKSCTVAADCRTGYTCMEMGATDKRGTVCYPLPAAGDAGP